MIDIFAVTDRLPAVPAGRVRKTVVCWVPGLKEDAPKRNFVLLIDYLKLIPFGVSLIRHLI